jgi:hypothetical protein
MVSDDELERHVNRVETSGPRRAPSGPIIGTDDADVGLAERFDRMQTAARDTHVELARRIEHVDEASAEVARVDDLAARMERIEARLAAIEDEIAD